jgi:hypothetical protein
MKVRRKGTTEEIEVEHLNPHASVEDEIVTPDGAIFFYELDVQDPETKGWKDLKKAVKDGDVEKAEGKVKHKKDKPKKDKETK